MTDAIRNGLATEKSQFGPDGTLRPPWSCEVSIRDACTSCGACIRACPESILKAGRAGTPIVDFDLGVCTFCAKCSQACPEPVFDLSEPPWTIAATVQSNCLLNAGVACRTCTDVCDVSALSFDLRGGSVGHIAVDKDACTGCGACLPVCPVNAIAWTETTPSQGGRS